jgi:hypothetical protein
VTTLNDFQVEISSFTGTPDDSDALAIVTKAVNDAIRRLDSRNWTWALMTQDITLVAGSVTASLASDFRGPRDMQLLNSAGDAVGWLGYQDPKTFMRDQSVPNVSDPEYYTVINAHESAQLRFDSTPSTAFVTQFPTARLRYYRTTTRLSNTSDVFDGPSAVESFVAWHGCAYMASRYAPDKMALALNEREQAWRMIVRDDLRIQAADWS